MSNKRPFYRASVILRKSAKLTSASICDTLSSAATLVACLGVARGLSLPVTDKGAAFFAPFFDI